MDGVLSVNPGFTGTITAEYEFTTNPTREIDFEHDHNGLRTRKKVVENGVTTTCDYTLHGKLITHLTKRVVEEPGAETTETLHFFYDAQSRPAFVEYEGEMYRYIHNLQGDIVAIVDSAGNKVVEYKYDAWGAIISHTGTMKGALCCSNPFCYRGYIFDEESLMYWLKDRYYYPERHRFINADALLGMRGMLLTHNSCSYCWNNPTIHDDPTGNLPSVEDVTLTYSFLGSLFLSLKGYEISKACYQHFLFGNGEPLDNDLLKRIGKEVSTSKVFRERILNNAPSDKNIWVDKPTNAIEMSGDLFYAIQHITPVSVCVRTPTAIIGISCFSDCYDFKYRSKEEEPDWFKRTVNNDCGYALQENGYGTNYMIDVLFSFYIPIE